MLYCVFLAVYVNAFGISTPVQVTVMVFQSISWRRSEVCSSTIKRPESHLDGLVSRGISPRNFAQFRMPFGGLSGLYDEVHWSGKLVFRVLGAVADDALLAFCYRTLPPGQGAGSKLPRFTLAIAGPCCSVPVHLHRTAHSALLKIYSPTDKQTGSHMFGHSALLWRGCIFWGWIFSCPWFCAIWFC